MNNVFSGGCACGRVRYECIEPPIVELICHCRDCQRASKRIRWGCNRGE
jgi:hypothetical protein